LIALRSWPRKEFLGGTAFGEVMGYAFHIGFLLALFFYVPHVLFFADIARGLFGTDLYGLTGLNWPTLPNGVVTLLSAISIAALVAVLIHRDARRLRWSPSHRSRPAWRHSPTWAGGRTSGCWRSTCFRRSCCSCGSRSAS
jgi:hypothetical protein